MKRQHENHPELKKKIEELSVHHKMGIEWWWDFKNVLDSSLEKEYSNGITAPIEDRKRFAVNSLPSFL